MNRLHPGSGAPCRPLTCDNGRDGGIRTRDLLLPKQVRWALEFPGPRDLPRCRPVLPRDAAYRRVWPDLTDEPRTNDQEGLITVCFRPGPTGRRAGLVAGPDVWEVIRAVKSGRAHEPDLADDALLTLVAEGTGVPVRLIRIAVRYWASYPGDIDAEIAAAEASRRGSRRRLAARTPPARRIADGQSAARRDVLRRDR